ncbi:MAG TPA: hypothetical protein VKE74_22570, partial [Gemmataceae bacterium]|nr:hypothetical protein [Gemmataceae bacterium]
HRRKNLSAMVRWAAQDGRSRPLVVVLGSSRSAMGLSPAHVRRGAGADELLVGNCSQTACLPIGQRLNLGRLLDTGPVPDYVLVEVLPPVLADPRPVEEQVRLQRLGRADLARLRPYLKEPDRVLARWAGTRVAGWYAYRYDLLAHAGRADLIPPHFRQDCLWSGLPPDGWGPFDPPAWPPEVRAGHLAVAHQTYDWLLADFRVNPETIRPHRDLLAECRARGIRAALLLMPESPTFRGWYPPAARVRVRDYLDELSREFGVPVFDASAWIDDEAAFMDGHHLLRPGAERFSERLGRECVGPWVRGELR